MSAVRLKTSGFGFNGLATPVLTATCPHPHPSEPYADLHLTDAMADGNVADQSVWARLEQHQVGSPWVGG
ncbi:hypothetical protein AQJ30_13400 [Streptomyces longwoodensis]|uniref:Uncharacterized protein n=1 Tax=Streptomyces longwoodensis TaxID=68231 RepID=A0A117QNS2_9ACTN|nr:hypothetical protein AQJ30_13400 [Streptomyces longwoodensis]